MKRLFQQIIRFGMVGFLCFFIDYGLMLALTELMGINYLISSAISFTVSVVVNYLLSMKFVFDAKERDSRVKEFVVFVFLSLIGLGINQLVMWVCVEKIGIIYQISKIGATAIVMVYNFISRKLILEK
ncbi:MAG: GtrA family protein [Clostridia bacterium]|nr:GtrA family protein [Clostridia bacterium]NCC45136.1 GtrA family protein [Clostridia bacterium]